MPTGTKDVTTIHCERRDRIIGKFPTIGCGTSGAMDQPLREDCTTRTQWHPSMVQLEGDWTNIRTIPAHSKKKQEHESSTPGKMRQWTLKEHERPSRLGYYPEGTNNSGHSNVIYFYGYRISRLPAMRASMSAETEKGSEIDRLRFPTRKRRPTDYRRAMLTEETFGGERVAEKIPEPYR